MAVGIVAWPREPPLYRGGATALPGGAKPPAPTKMCDESEIRRPYCGARPRAVAFVCVAEILSLTSFSLVPALLPQFIVSWSLSNAEAGWLAGMMSAGYMAAVLPLVALTDRMPARTIFLASSALNALSCFGIALGDGLHPALIWRAVSGIAVAGMYMPGLRALTDGMAGATRARAAAWYTSSFTLGSSLSFLLGQAGLMWDWRAAFVVSGQISSRRGSL